MSTAMAGVPKRYEFEETGVGCTNDGRLDCLCDVKIISVTPLAYPPSGVHYSRLAADLCMKEFDKITWEGWAGWLCAITDEAAKRKVGVLVDALAECQADQLATPTFGMDTRSVALRSYLILLPGGYDTVQCAQILATEPEDLYGLLCNMTGDRSAIARLGFEAFTLLEFMLKDGSLSTTEMAKELDCSRDTVQGHANRMGITPPVGIKGRAQAPEVVASMTKWIATDLSSRKIVAKIYEETGVKVSANHVLRHRAKAQ